MHVVVFAEVFLFFLYGVYELSLILYAGAALKLYKETVLTPLSTDSAYVPNPWAVAVSEEDTKISTN